MPITPFDLSKYPHWQELVKSNSAYKKAWLEGRFPPGFNLTSGENTGKSPSSRIPTARVIHPIIAPIPDEGPGKEMELLLKELSVPTKSGGCNSCHKIARQMNAWGVEGCRKNMDRLVKHFRTHIKDYSWMERLKAAAMAVATGLAFQLDWLNPIPSLINEAIRRAEVKKN